MKIYLITGGLGFIGSNYIEEILKNKNNFVINLDKKTYCSNEDRFLKFKNYTFFKGDICDESLVSKIFQEYKIDYVLNFAAESHVDNSLTNPSVFVKSNILGVANLLFCANKFWKNKKNKRFIQISTDEVYGSSLDKEFFETDPLNPTSPYSSSKASAELLCKSYFESFDFPVIITRSSNNYGFFQHPEKLIPKTFLNLYQKMPAILYKNSIQNKRNWLFVKDNVNAINLVLEKGIVGEIYNICSNIEKTNIQIVEKIIEYFQKNINPKIDKKFIKIINSRPHDDKRYLINSDKIKKLGFTSSDFEQTFEETLDFYKNNYLYLLKQHTKCDFKNK